LFLESKNLIERWNLPPEISIKLQKAEVLAKQRLQKKKEEERRARLEKEKQELPSLVSRCVDWAVTHALKRVTHADIDVFILENNLDMLPETKRALYSMTNFKMKPR